MFFVVSIEIVFVETTQHGSVTITPRDVCRGWMGSTLCQLFQQKDPQSSWSTLGFHPIFHSLSY
jgi:hypothetical protein